jgi:hypothetical protein
LGRKSLPELRWTGRSYLPGGKYRDGQIYLPDVRRDMVGVGAVVTHHTPEQAAKLFDLPLKLALYLRGKHLRDEMLRCGRWLDWHAEQDDPVIVLMGWPWLEEFCKLARQLREGSLSLAGIERQGHNRITDEMVATARSASITRVVEFDRQGKAGCFAHQDKRPSLSHWVKGNKASCFVCNKRWSAIDVLMERDGLSFQDAVRRLQ